MTSILAGNNNERVGMNAQFNSPYDIAIDQQTVILFVSDSDDHNIRKITPKGKLFYIFFLISHVS
jgi:hypothetical protein